MKIIKFAPHLVTMVISGEKTSTWRPFDDKNLTEGDKLLMVNKETGEEFAEAVITRIREKKFCDIQESDYIGHEAYKSQQEMLDDYKRYYGDRVSMSTEVKMIDFKLEKIY